MSEYILNVDEALARDRLTKAISRKDAFAVRLDAFSFGYYGKPEIIDNPNSFASTVLEIMVKQYALSRNALASAHDQMPNFYESMSVEQPELIG